jgi:hypothetical protein
MTRTQAYNSMKMLGNIITHKDFSKGEYIWWNKNQIMTEDGYDFSSQFHDKNRTRFDDGWSVL